MTATTTTTTKKVRKALTSRKGLALSTDLATLPFDLRLFLAKAQTAMKFLSYHPQPFRCIECLQCT